jgi:hypothetical protein
MKAAITKLQTGTSILITTSMEFVFLIAHSSLLNLGLTPIQEIPSSVPGFAASLKGTINEFDPSSVHKKLFTVIITHE